MNDTNHENCTFKKQLVSGNSLNGQDHKAGNVVPPKGATGLQFRKHKLASSVLNVKFNTSTILISSLNDLDVFNHLMYASRAVSNPLA